MNQQSAGDCGPEKDHLPKQQPPADGQSPQTPGPAPSFEELAQQSEKTLLERWKSHQDREAAAELWRRYYEKLAREARKSRQQVIDDSVYASAILQVLKMDNKRFNYDRDDWIWRLLARIVSNKRISRLRKRKPLGIESVAPLMDSQPSQEEVADYNDKVAQMMEILEPHEQAYFECRESGLKQVEIARKMQVDVRTVYRWGLAVQAKVQRLFGNQLDE
jgi:RNA polymerase sigma factor (sigma-70 family)